MQRRLRLLSRLHNALTAAAFAALSLFLLLSNDFDWDFFLSSAEVDRRAWLIDGNLPLWSYQLCGGVTRAGDPQALGLSPLFAPVLAFGSFWGLKVLGLGLSIVGFLSLKGILELLLRPEGGTRRLVDRQIASCVSLSFVFGNYFLWHLNQGHLTFALAHVALAALYLVLKSYRESFSWRGAALLAVVSFSYFSGAIYHSLVFFVIPTVIALAGLTAWSILRRQRELGSSRARLAAALSAGLIGALLGAYKPLSVLAYQRSWPRTLASGRALESTSLWQTLLYQSVPTRDFRFAGFFRGWGPWGIWEYSAFNLNIWLGVVFGGWALVALARGGLALRAGRLSRWLPLLAAALALSGELFALGDRGPSLHRALNLALNDSVRVIGRYQGILALSIAVGVAFVLAALRPARRFMAGPGSVGVPVCLILNLLTFRSSVGATSLWTMLGYQSAQVGSMNELVVTRARTLRQSFMYQPLLLGGAVLNCYDPIARPAMMTREFVGQPELMEPQGKALREGVLSLVDPERSNPAARCVEGSYFTQNQLVLDSSCGPGTCVNINALNGRDTTGLQLDPQVGKFCLPLKAP